LPTELKMLLTVRRTTFVKKSEHKLII